jgi:hypothetical protein
MKCIYAALMLVSLCLVAQAGTIPFSQGFIENNVGPFTQIDVIASPGSTLTASDGGTLLTPAYETWSFTPGISEFTFTLSGQQPDTPDLPAVMAFFALNGEIVVDWANVIFVNGQWRSIDTLAPDGSAYQEMRAGALAAGQAPEPAAYLLMGSGMIGLALFRRKRK